MGLLPKIHKHFRHCIWKGIKSGHTGVNTAWSVKNCFKGISLTIQMVDESKNMMFDAIQNA
jgi:hypothetical protein